MTEGKLTQQALNPVIIQEPLRLDYDSVEFNLANGLSDYNLKSNQSAAFQFCTNRWTTVSIRSDQNITIKFNATTYNAITITAGRPYELDNLFEIRNIFITNNSGSTAAIKIIGVDKS
jgi:hypothetical protein